MLRIRYSNGKIAYGVLLALGDQRIRVALKDSDDVSEYRLVSQHWVSEDCDIVTMDFTETEYTDDAGEEFPDSLVTSGFDRPVASRIM